MHPHLSDLRQLALSGSDRRGLGGAADAINQDLRLIGAYAAVCRRLQHDLQPLLNGTLVDAGQGLRQCLRAHLRHESLHKQPLRLQASIEGLVHDALGQLVPDIGGGGHEPARELARVADRVGIAALARLPRRGRRAAALWPAALLARLNDLLVC